jgi:YD repeat-containing protein
VITQKDGNGTLLFSYYYSAYDGARYTKITDGLGNISYDYFDDQNRLVRQEDANHNVINSSSYNGKKDLVSGTDGRGYTTSYSRDEHGGVTLTSKTVSGQLIETHSLYDNSGSTLSGDTFNNLVWSKDAEGKETNYVYDTKGNLLEIHYPDSSEVSYTYYSNGQRETSTDANGKITTYYYGSYGNLSKIQAPFKNGTYTITEYEYDGRSKLINQWEDPGKTGGVCTNYVYYDNDRLKYTYGAYGTTAGTTTYYEYDTNGNRTKIVDAALNETIYSYDARDNLKQVTQYNIMVGKN